MNYNWIISALDVKLSEGEMKNVVYNIHWRRSLTDGELSAESYGTCPVGEPTPEAFVSYEDLTKEEVEGWLEGNLDVESIDAALLPNIELQKNPVSETLNPPFEQ